MERYWKHWKGMKTLLTVLAGVLLNLFNMCLLVMTIPFECNFFFRLVFVKTHFLLLNSWGEKEE